MTRTLNMPEWHTLVSSTLAKDGVFKAQDAASLIEDDDLRRRVQRDLLVARDHLEAIDRVLRDAIHHD
jgi:hypothetical protein